MNSVHCLKLSICFTFFLFVFERINVFFTVFPNLNCFDIGHEIYFSWRQHFYFEWTVQICTIWYLMDLNIPFYLTSDLLPPIPIYDFLLFFYTYLLKWILRLFSQKDSGHLIFLNSSKREKALFFLELGIEFLFKKVFLRICKHWPTVLFILFCRWRMLLAWSFSFISLFVFVFSLWYMYKTFLYSWFHVKFILLLILNIINF